MQFNQDFFEPPPLAPDLEWMLQSNQVNDADLAVQLTRDYGNRLHALALILLRDEGASALAVAAALQTIIRQRTQYWGQVPLRAWIYMQAINVMQRRASIGWRFKRWQIHSRQVTHPADAVSMLRQALLRLDLHLALPVYLVYGHDLSVVETALVIGIPEDTLLGLLESAERMLPAHTEGELVQAAHPIENTPSEALNPDAEKASHTAPEPPQLQRRLLSHLLPNLARQAHQSKYRRMFSDVSLILFVASALLLAGWYAFRVESEKPETITPTMTKNAQVVVRKIEVTATPQIVVVAQADRSGTTKVTSTAEPRKSELDLSLALTRSGLKDVFPYNYENSGPLLLTVVLNSLNVRVSAQSVTNFLQPGADDVTIFPYEIEDYIVNQTRLNYIYRFGGDLETLRWLIEANFPVLLQKTYSGQGVEGWEAEFGLVTGFDDYAQLITLLSVRSGSVQTEQIGYDSFLSGWLPFGYAYIVVYPRQRADDLANLLGDQMDAMVNYEAASELLMFGWRKERMDRFWESFAIATLMTYRQDYGNAAMAYTQAFFHYELIPAAQRPWRIFWYNSRPYWAYYYAQDYRRTISLADQTIEAAGDRGLEESLYWRAMARLAAGEKAAALEDIKTALSIHPDFGPALYLLETLQVPMP